MLERQWHTYVHPCHTSSHLRIIGTDPDQHLLAKADARLDNIHNPINVFLISALAEALSIDDQGIDIVFSTITLHHLPTPIKKSTGRNIPHSKTK